MGAAKMAKPSSLGDRLSMGLDDIIKSDKQAAAKAKPNSPKNGSKGQNNQKKGGENNQKDQKQNKQKGQQDKQKDHKQKNKSGGGGQNGGKNGHNNGQKNKVQKGGNAQKNNTSQKGNAHKGSTQKQQVSLKPAKNILKPAKNAPKQKGNSSGGGGGSHSKAVLKPAPQARIHKQIPKRKQRCQHYAVRGIDIKEETAQLARTGWLPPLTVK